MIDRDNVFRIIDACQPDMQTALVLVRFVGLQVRAMVSLRWTDIDAERLRITIGSHPMPRCCRQSCGHMRGKRVVPLNLDAIEILNSELVRQRVEGLTKFVVSNRLRVAALRCGLTDEAWNNEVTNVARRVDMTMDGHPLSVLRESLRSEWAAAFGGHVAGVWMGTESRDHAHDHISDETLAMASRMTFEEFAVQG